VPPAPDEDDLARWAREEGGLPGTYRFAVESRLPRAPLSPGERSNDVLKPGQKVGAVGVAEHFGTYGRGRYAGATGEGERVGVKGVAIDLDPFAAGGARDRIGDNNRPGNGIGVLGISGAGTGVRGDSRTGVGVAGKSRSVAGVEGQSEYDVGGVFVSNTQAQLRLYPTLRELPDTGRAGDLIALLGRHATLDVPTAELWFCVRASADQHKALWKRVCFDESADGAAPPEAGTP
jgi:hypothetical protein